MPDHSIDDPNALRAWIGRTQVKHDRIDPWHAGAMHATLNCDGPAPEAGGMLPHGWHWLFFREAVRRDGLGDDGHPARGDFLPPVSLPERMWAGGRLEFSGTLPIGSEVDRLSTIKDVAAKTGRSGPLVFVTVEHRLNVNGTMVLREEHDIVYREPARPSGAKQAAGSSSTNPGRWHRAISTDTTLLFRYSALTFNGHRIHYDGDYCRDVAGYPGLVVHGPLTATLLMHLCQDNMPGRTMASFSFRARAPIFCGETLELSGGLDDDGTGRFQVEARGPNGRLIMSADGQSKLA